MVGSVPGPGAEESVSRAQAIPQREEYTFPDFPESPNSISATGAWALPVKNIEDAEFLQIPNAASSDQSISRSHRLSTELERSVATIDNGQQIFVPNGTEEGPWYLREQASMEESTHFEQHAKPEISNTLSFDAYLIAGLERLQKKAQSIVSKAKKELTGSLMAEVNTTVERLWKETMTAAAATEISSTQSTNPSIPSSGQKSGTKRKRNIRRRDSPPSKYRYRCPIRAYDPTGGIIGASWSRACYGEGFLTISKIREHFNRAHRLRLHCETCWTKMRSAEELSNHTEIGCTARDWEPGYWIRDSDMDLINTHGISWEEIFRIIFPGILVPSPLACQINQVYRYKPIPKSNFFTKIAPRVEELLESALGRAPDNLIAPLFAPLQEELRAYFAQIVRDIQLANSYTVDPIELRQSKDGEIPPGLPLSVDETRTQSSEQLNSIGSFQDFTGHTEYSFSSRTYFDDSICECLLSHQTDTEICSDCGFKRLRHIDHEFEA